MASQVKAALFVDGVTWKTSDHPVEIWRLLFFTIWGTRLEFMYRHIMGPFLRGIKRLMPDMYLVLNAKTCWSILHDFGFGTFLHLKNIFPSLKYFFHVVIFNGPECSPYAVRSFKFCNPPQLLSEYYLLLNLTVVFRTSPRDSVKREHRFQMVLPLKSFKLFTSSWIC